MQIITGQAVRKENFWKREKELEDMLYKINSNQHILLVAPRRVGKTSIMQYIADNQNTNNIVLYIDTESANSENEFWKKLFHRLKDEEFVSTLKNKATNLWNTIQGITITEITTKGVKFGETREIEYVEAFKRILQDLDKNIKIIIMIDEFAQTIENIIKYENIQSAQSLLDIHRELRQDKKLSEQITFVYAGSIGLESVASKIDRISAINDLARVKVFPLELEDAKAFIYALAENNSIDIVEEQINYILQTLEWLIPFYIQLVMDELRKSKQTITNTLIDSAFKLILDNRNHFEHWHLRLKSFDDNEYKFAREVLNITSENTIIQSNQIFDLATKHSLSEDRAKEVRNSLVYDGYINDETNPKEFRFNSPLLKMWWYKNVAN